MDPDRSDERYMKLLASIVVFRVSLDSVDASFKLNQNKGEQDQISVIGALNKTGCPFDSEIASLMSSNIQSAQLNESESKGKA